MIVTEMKPTGEILEMLGREKSVFVLCCGGCPEGFQSGGLARGEELAAALRAGGKEVAGVAEIEFLCTISMGARQGLWAGEERCGQCGDCLLDRTGGICPVTACSKSLVNGTCGGTNDGQCEVDSHRPCGWLRIYERLRDLGRVESLKSFNAPRDHRKFDFPEARRKTVLWALEVAGGDETGDAGEGAKG